MRLFERLTRIYHEGDEALRRLVLHQMETDTLDFEADECLAFLEGVVARESAPLATQARRTLRRLMPQYYALRYRLRQAPSTAKAGTWTEYNIDRAEIDKLKRLGLAKTQDFTQIQMDQFLRSALHLLSAPVGRLLDKLERYADGGKTLAIQCLAHLATPEAAHALEEVAGLGAPATRVAAGALGDMKTDAGFQALAKLFASAKDPEVACDVAAEFRHYPTAAARDLLLAAADAGAPQVKIGAAIAFASFGKLGGSQALMRLAREEAPVSRWAVDGLGRLAEPGTIGDLAAIWADAPDAWTRRLCISAAGATRDRRAQDFIKRAMNASDPDQRALALESLIRVHVPEQELFDLAFKLVNDPHPEVAVNALLAVAPIDTGMVQHRLRGLMSDANWLSRRLATWCMGYVQGPASLATLKHVIYHDGDERVVLGAVKALAKYDDSENAELLLGMLRHQSRAVRLSAARVLTECRDRDIARKLFPKVAQVVATEGDAKVRAQLVRALSRLGDPSQYLLIGKALKDASEDVIVAAIEGLDVLGSIDSIGLVEPFLSDARPAVRSQAALALWNQGEIRVAKRLAEGLDSNDEHLVQGSLHALSEILASLRRLEDSSKYVLLFSELKANLKSPDFVAYASKLKDVRVESPVSSSRVFDVFEFRTVVDKTLPPVQDPESSQRSPAVAAAAEARSGSFDRPEPRSGAHAAVAEPRSGAHAAAAEPRSGAHAPPAEARSGSYDRPEPPSRSRVVEARSEPKAAPPPPPRPSGPVSAPLQVPVNGPASEPLEVIDPMETTLERKGLGFLPPPSDPDDEFVIESSRRPGEMEIEDLLSSVVKGEGRAVLSRLFELARADGGPAAQLLAAQVLVQVAPADPREREANILRAADELERAAKAQPGRVEAHVLLAELLSDLDRPRVYRHVIAAVRSAAEMLTQQATMAEEALASGKPEDAAAIIGQLSRQLPLMPQANALHGEVLYRRGDYEGAVEQLYLAHVAEPSSIPLLLWLVRAAARAKKDAYARHLLVNLLERRDVDRETAERARSLLKKLA